jgi:hypothetical protein
MKCESRFTQNTQVIFHKEKNGAYLYNPDSGNLKYVNKIGTSLYELCDGLHPREEMTTQIAQEYQSVPMDQIEKDIDSFLADLLRMGFIKRAQ